MKTIVLKIVTPERTVAESAVVSITLPTQEGEITVLPDHIPYIGVLKAGEVTFREKEASGSEMESSLAVSGGFVEFHDNTLTVLADTAEYVEEIDMVRAEEAKKRAEDLMRQSARTDNEEYARVAAALEKQLSRIRVARKHRSRKTID